jgi:oligopeptide transport system substrate-binding protein
MNPRNKARAIAIANTPSKYHLGWMLLAALVLALALMASPGIAAEKVILYGNGAEPNSLDPHRATGTWENNIIGDMILGLYTEDTNGKPIFGAAESAETSKDGLTWTFKIRDHVWSDGKPVTAGDFVFGFKRILNPATAAEYAQLLFPVKNARAVNTNKAKVDDLGIRAIDDKTLVIELEDPAPYLPELLTHYTAFPIPKHVFDKFGEKWSRTGNYVSNGPYKLIEWRPGDRVVIAKNEKFYDAASVKIDKAVYFPTQDDVAAMKRYRAGELDMHERWPLTEVKWLKENIPSEARSYTYLMFNYTAYNMTRKPFDDIRVRKALAMSIDRKRIAEEVFFNSYGVAATSFLPEGTANVDMSGRVFYLNMTMEERVAQAKKYMEEAGYGPNKRLRLSYNIGNTQDGRRMAVAMQAMWKDIYVDAEIFAQDTAVHYKTLQTKNFDVGAAAWVLDYNDAKNIMYLFESTTIDQNYSGYNNPEFDALMRQADGEADNGKRATILGKMNEMLLRDVPSTPNFNQYERKIIKPYVLGFVENPRIINRTRWLDISPEAQTIASRKVSIGSGGAGDASEGDFWSWLASWFSAEAWSKWWNG